jgi:hypothetical protein
MGASPGDRCGNGSAALQTQANRTAAILRSIAAFRFAARAEDLRLDIERKRAMFPKHKISRPGFLRFIAGIGA